MCFSKFSNAALIIAAQRDAHHGVRELHYEMYDEIAIFIIIIIIIINISRIIIIVNLCLYRVIDASRPRGSARDASPFYANPDVASIN